MADEGFADIFQSIAINIRSTSKYNFISLPQVHYESRDVFLRFDLFDEANTVDLSNFLQHEVLACFIPLVIAVQVLLEDIFWEAHRLLRFHL
jgi:hypothetical protein